MKSQPIVICGAVFAEELGLNEAIVLQHFYYLQRNRDANDWICNSYQIWQEEFRYLPPRAIRETFASLVKQGFLESRRGKRGNLYRLHYELANKFLLDPMAIELHIDGTTPIVIVTDSSMRIEQKSEEGKLQQMLDIWQKKIPNAGQPLAMTHKRSIMLQSLLVNVFNSQLDEWTNFVDRIASSDFLMGKVTKFKVFLDWAITPENCTKILEGAYNNKNISDQKQIENACANVNANLALIANKDWQETSKLLVKVLGAPTYQSWFSRVKFKCYENNCVYLEAETRFIRDWVDSHYALKIKRIWFEATQKEVACVIVKPKLV